MSDLEKLIAAVEAGNPEWNADFIDGLVGWDMNPRPALLVLHAWNGSLDAALRLHEALLPGWTFDVTNDSAFVMRPDAPSIVPVDWDEDLGQYQADGPPARAWLLAILNALQAMEGAA